MQVRNALTDPNVDRDKRTLGVEPHLERLGEEFHLAEEGGHEVIGEITQISHVGPRHQE